MDQPKKKSPKIKTRTKDACLYSDALMTGEDDEDADDGYIGRLNLEHHLTSDRYNSSAVLDMQGKDFTVAWIQEHGFSSPLLFRSTEGLGIKVPAASFSVSDVRLNVGSRRTVDVMDVRTQKNTQMTMKQWQQYYETHSQQKQQQQHQQRSSSSEADSDRLLNVISLEFSRTRLDRHVQAPIVVRQLDWVECVWPQHLKRRQTDCTNSLDHMMYPKVQKYCLMSVRGCFTDFHIDFGGSSVWYHVLRGGKVFWLIAPSEHNLSLFEKWLLTDKHTSAGGFFGSQVELCTRIQLHAGQTFFIPSGWIHAVYTPVDSLVFGGNFLHSFGIETQLRVARLEDTTKVEHKYRYPFFTEILWYVLERYVHCVLHVSHLSSSSSSAAVDDAAKTSPPPQSPPLTPPHQQHVHLTPFELRGLKAIVQYLHTLPVSRKNVPPLLRAEHAAQLVQNVRLLVLRHRRDNATAACTGTLVLQQQQQQQQQKLSLTGCDSTDATSGAGSAVVSPPSTSSLSTLLTIKTESAEQTLNDCVSHDFPIASDACSSIASVVSAAAEEACGVGSGDAGCSSASARAAAANTPLALARRSSLLNKPKKGDRRRRVRCRECEGCTRGDCTECVCCKDMLKYGGSGSIKQSCKMRICQRPQLPLTTVCCYCGLNGWGQVVSPVTGKRAKTDAPSMLYECRSCFKIAHLQCSLRRNNSGVDGRVLVELPNCWTCPSCVLLGVSCSSPLSQSLPCSTSPTAAAEAPGVVKRRPGRPPGRPRKPLPQLPDGVPASQLLDTAPFRWQPPSSSMCTSTSADVLTSSAPHPEQHQQDMQLGSSVETNEARTDISCSPAMLPLTSAVSSAVELSPPVSDNQRRDSVQPPQPPQPSAPPAEHCATAAQRPLDAPSDLLATFNKKTADVEMPREHAAEVEHLQHPPVCSAQSLDAIYNRHSMLLAQLQTTTRRTLKRPLFVVRPAERSPPPPAATALVPACVNHEALVAVFRRLPREQLLSCQLVCRRWCAAALDPRLWPRVAVPHHQPLSDHRLRYIVRRQPATLSLSWSQTTHAQLAWLLARLPATRALHLAGVSVAAVAALRSACCPPLATLELSHVHALTDQRVKYVFSPPTEPRPGSTFSGTRLARLRRLLLADTAVTDATCRLLADLLPRLRQLDVSGCVRLTDASLAHLACLPRLRQLDVSGCVQLTERGLASFIAACASLHELKVAHIPLVNDAVAVRLSQQHNVYVCVARDT